MFKPAEQFTYSNYAKLLIVHIRGIHIFLVSVTFFGFPAVIAILAMPHFFVIIKLKIKPQG